jgi:formate dehydrogenase subunit gamma
MMAALTYVYLLLTGLAFWTPALFWLAIVLGGGFLTRVLHVWVGLAFSIVLAWMYAAWRREMRTTAADREWRKAIRHYIRNEDERIPPSGKFNYGQKQFFWAMVWGGLALLVSGVVLWLPQGWPLAVRQAAVLVHAVATLVTIAGFIIHVYMGVAVEPGSLRAIIGGEVTEAWARHHHALWADEVAASGAADGSPRERSPSVAGDVASRR